ncbi:hypothetical protein K505DRAFT_307284 [Melanomma pulvis-pyrius CBS 109.77]|uniref:Uncharacterized protein n=1 Tax=Melanomma pulvis-pyrius CBS 109.77 TaxID=1314802 RepID=A0A6A6X8R9_9PLEO|nr:hypothetical protein K505DRAFT_307284 [Melanomma pulvis-pyrius CBS 109.77]
MPAKPTIEAPSELAARLRLDRDHWRTRSLRQDSQLLAADLHIKAFQHNIFTLTTANTDLQNRLDKAMENYKMRNSDYHTMCDRNYQLIELIENCENRNTKLRKSDRMKEKVHQRNLRLKAQIQGHVCGNKGDNEQTILEALAAANERIEELEKAGEKLLDALDWMGDSDGSDSSEEGEEENGELSRVGLVEAEVAFRGILEDETFREHKALWEDLLEP